MCFYSILSWKRKQTFVHLFFQTPLRMPMSWAVYLACNKYDEVTISRSLPHPASIGETNFEPLFYHPAFPQLYLSTILFIAITNLAVSHLTIITLGNICKSILSTRKQPRSRLLHWCLAEVFGIEYWSRCLHSRVFIPFALLFNTQSCIQPFWCE